MVRKLTERVYAAEIEDLYNANDWGVGIIGPILRASYSYGSVKSFVRTIVTGCFSGIKFGDSDDFYVLGLDSLKTVEIADSLQANPKSQASSGDSSSLSSKMVYADPSINQLALVLPTFSTQALYRIIRVMLPSVNALRGCHLWSKNILPPFHRDPYGRNSGELLQEL